VNRFVRSSFVVLGVTLALGACQKEFNPKLYPDPEQLYAVGLKELHAHHWGNASKAFDQLTRDLPVRDTLLPLSYYYLGEAQAKNGEHLLAANSFSRVADAFPEDSLAPRAMYLSGFEYAKMWRKPELDPQYGHTALQTLHTLIEYYPKSVFVKDAQTLIDHLDEMLARKDFETGYSYYRRHAYDSGIIYFKDVIKLHPDTPAARDAYLYLVDAYRKIHYTDDARDACSAMRKRYPNDKEIIDKCGSASSAEASTPPTSDTTSPPSTPPSSSDSTN
jgi:outer membrane assembly lipoprotein YfiO